MVVEKSDNEEQWQKTLCLRLLFSTFLNYFIYFNIVSKIDKYHSSLTKNVLYFLQLNVYTITISYLIFTKISQNEGFTHLSKNLLTFFFPPHTPKAEMIQ